MAVKIRLRRMGKKRQPIYKVVAADVRSPRDGRFIEALGLYNPKTEPVTVELNEERALYWLGVGAQPTTTVKGLLNKKGILLKRELIKSGLSEDEVAAKMAEWEKQQEAKLAAAAKKKENKAATKAEETKAAETEKTEEKSEEIESEVVGATSENTDAGEKKEEEGS